MAVTYGFYNALNHDRLYDAIQMSSIFDGIIRDGIFSTIGTSMVVTAPEDGLYVNVGPGRAWFNHTWTLNDTEYPVEAEEAEVVLDRIDAVILEVNSAAEVRANSIKFLKGTPASEPVKPTLTHNAEVNQYALAYVRIRAGQSTIFQADVENAVGTDETPFVSGLMQQVSIENLILQWEAEFDDHFENWRNVNEAEFEVWSSDMQDEYNRWILNQVNTYQTWFASIQAEAGDDIDAIMAWFEHMKGQVSEDAAIHLQEEIDDLALAAEKGSVVTIHTINQTLYGKNCVISQDGQSRTARFDNTGTAVFESIPYVGQVTVTATDGILTAVTYLTIPYFGRYTTNLAFWAATVNISTQSPEFFSLPIKVFKNDVLIETISFSALGSATYIATSEGTYKFSVTYDDADFDHTIEIDEETTYTVVINDWNATLNMQTSVSELYGRGITISKGGVTVGTTTFNGSGRATYKVHEPGTYHIVTSTAGGDTYQADVVVTEETAYSVDLGLPNGRTVLPTDDIQTWLHCAGINDKGYTTLAEVLEDSVTFNALLGDSNACDYMARSATFASKGEGLVPAMTSDTTPSGTVIHATGYNEGTYPAYSAMDGNTSNRGWLPPRTGDVYIGYKFTNPTKVSSFYLKLHVYDSGAVAGDSFKVQGSNDDTTWTDLGTFTYGTIAASGGTAIINESLNNATAYTSYRLIFNNTIYPSPYSTAGYVDALQFYSNPIGITDDPLAMSLLGRYDYACDAVLANEDWAEAIGNSEYWELVLDNTVPKMTSNTTPSGVAIGSDNSAGHYAAFDKNTSTQAAESSSYTPQYVGYHYPNKALIKRVTYRLNAYSYGADPGYYAAHTAYVEGSNDGETWITLASKEFTRQEAATTCDIPYVFNLYDNDTAYEYIRVRTSNGTYTGNGGFVVGELEFYGRTSQNLIPLVPTMTGYTTPSGEVIGEMMDSRSGVEGWRNFDGSLSTSGNLSTPWWVGYDFGTAKVVNAASFAGWDEADQGATIYIEATNDKTGTWTELTSKTFTAAEFIASHSTPYVFTFTNTTAYRYYRLRSSGADYSVGGQLHPYEIQFYAPAPTSVIHSVPNDTVYYLENGVETTLCTCDSNGVGEVDWSELPQGVMTLYSTTAKDPDNLSNDFSMNIRVTPNKVDAFLIPDRALYWWGWVDENLEECSPANGWSADWVYISPVPAFGSPSYNTNSLGCSSVYSTGSSRTVVEVGTKRAIQASKMKWVVKAIAAMPSSTVILVRYQRQSGTKYIGNRAGVIQATTTDVPLNSTRLIELEATEIGDFYWTIEDYNGMNFDLYAMFYEV